eukprot:801592-Rhodomonas_salina.1
MTHLSTVVDNLTEWEMIRVRTGKEGYLWMTVQWQQGHSDLPPSVAWTAMYIMQLARTAPLSMTVQDASEKKYHSLINALRSWPEALTACEGATGKDVEATVE